MKRKLLWDIIEKDWKEVNMTLNGNRVHLPTSVIIPLRDNFKIRSIIKREPLLLHIMLKQGMTWFSLENSSENNAIPEIALEILYVKISLQKMASQINPVCDFSFGFLHCDLHDDTIDIDLKIRTIRRIHTYEEDHDL